MSVVSYWLLVAASTYEFAQNKITMTSVFEAIPVLLLFGVGKPIPCNIKKPRIWIRISVTMNELVIRLRIKK